MAPNNRKIIVAWAPSSWPICEGPDLLATSLAAHISAREDLELVEGRVLLVSETIKVLESASGESPCGLILVGRSGSTRSLAQACIVTRADIVIVEVDVASDIVYFNVPNPGLEQLLRTLHELVEQVGAQLGDRLTPIRLTTDGSFSSCERPEGGYATTGPADAEQGACGEQPSGQNGPGQPDADSGVADEHDTNEAPSAAASADVHDSNPTTADEKRGEGQMLLSAIRWFQSVLAEAGICLPAEDSAVQASSPPRPWHENSGSASNVPACESLGDDASAAEGYGGASENTSDGDDSKGDGGARDCGGRAGGDGGYGAGQGGGNGGGGPLGSGDSGEPGKRPLLIAAIKWIRAVLWEAVQCTPDDSEQSRGLSRSREAMLRVLADSVGRRPDDHEAACELSEAFAHPSSQDDPLAIAYRAFDLSWREFELMLLALAPELDPSFQLCSGYLQDDLSRRTGTLAFYCSLLGEPTAIREEFAQDTTLWRWLVFEGRGTFPDEPLRLDPAFAQWLLGEHEALAGDARVRRALRTSPWLGARVLDDREHQILAAELRSKLEGCGRAQWTVLNGDDLPSWRALLELASHGRPELLRVEPARLAGADAIDVEDCARRIARVALLTRRPVAVDLASGEGVENADSAVDVFLAAFDATGGPAAALSRDHTCIIRSSGSASFEIEARRPLSRAGRVAAVRKAARHAGAYLTGNEAQDVANSFPLSVDGLEQAMHLAKNTPPTNRYGESPLQRFLRACRQLAVEGLSNLAERIEPVFRIADVVLPADRKQQLSEIVDHVRLAPKVYDAWKFGEQLPYGRGVSALFFGPSGTGKTMAAMAIARELGVQLLRIDLSRVVSKYIGDTEKNIDRVFNDAQQSGSAILIDEADALLGKRSEVKDAHDRYANIEVAYVLQRMEAYEGLAILTSNMRQNMDAAFLRRLRFIVDFPRPDVHAREQIWRFCLPKESHELDDAAFRQLARKIDLTGGHIRQITLRAAFLAVAEGVRINLAHLAAAARAEFAKLGMPPSDIDLNLNRRAA